MKVKTVFCWNCGRPVPLQGRLGLGRKPLNIPLTKICEALQAHGNALGASKYLGCSEAYIFKVLKANSLKVEQVLEEKLRTHSH